MNVGRLLLILYPKFSAQKLMDEGTEVEQVLIGE